jgi:hypothetical protein
MKKIEITKWSEEADSVPGVSCSLKWYFHLNNFFTKFGFHLITRRSRVVE